MWPYSPHCSLGMSHRTCFTVYWIWNGQDDKNEMDVQWNGHAMKWKCNELLQMSEETYRCHISKTSKHLPRGLDIHSVKCKSDIVLFSTQLIHIPSYISTEKEMQNYFVE